MTPADLMSPTPIHESIVGYCLCLPDRVAISAVAYGWLPRYYLSFGHYEPLLLVCERLSSIVNACGLLAGIGMVAPFLSLIFFINHYELLLITMFRQYDHY